MGASAQVLRHATGFLVISSHQTIPASGNLEFELVAGPPQGPVGPAGPREDSPATAVIETPVRQDPPFLTKPQMRENPLLIPPSRTGRPGGDVPEEEIEVAIVVATQMIATPQLRGVGRRMGSRIRFRSPNSEARKDIPKM